jgi:predicted molibdopterin-dependent oxidoreductase YjgC
LPVQPGLTASEMLRAAAAGSLKALFVLGENSWPDGRARAVRNALDKCEFLVLSEALPSEMSRYADVLLPDVTFAETSGTYTNTERRIQLVRQAIEPQGNARPAWKVLGELAHRICARSERRLVDGICPGWDYEDPADIMEEIASLTPIYAGVSHARLQRGDRLMWPVEGPEGEGTEMLSSGRGRFIPVG